MKRGANKNIQEYKMRIEFYNNNDKYLGFKKFRGYTANFLELRSWILSENYVIINHVIINNIIELAKILKRA